MDNWKNQIIKSLKDELVHLLIISASVFLFILFFQPFPLKILDFNNQLLYVTGFGVITFLLASIILIILPILIPKWFKIKELESNLPFILGFLLLTLTATAFAFYMGYVGMVLLSFYIMFKVVLVCLLPLFILLILDKNKMQERVISILQEQNKYYLSKIRKYEKLGEDEKIDILSNNKSDKLTLKRKHIVSVKSADNYIEISYLENNLVEKKLIRSTLKNIESQLGNQRSFIRCHRTSIVNIIYIEKLERNYSGYSLKMSCFDEKIPVSRQYFMQVKEAISVN